MKRLNVVFGGPQDASQRDGWGGYLLVQPTAEPRPGDLPITYEIRHLRELLELLE